MMLDVILADSRVVKNEEYGSDIAVKGLDRAIRECFGPKKSMDILRIKDIHLRREGDFGGTEIDF